MEKVQAVRGRARKAARVREEGGAVVVVDLVPVQVDHVSVQVVVKKYLTNWEFPAMSSAVQNVEAP
jgi:hypothetical protein